VLKGLLTKGEKIFDQGQKVNDWAV